MAPHPLALPQTLSPDALDTLTEMAAIVSRLRTAIHASSSAGGLPGSTPAAATTTGATPTVTGSGGGGAGSPSSVGGGRVALALKDVPTATDTLKHKLQRARLQVKALPDMGRAVADQEAEIRELEARIARQREVLDTLRAAGADFVAGDGHDVKMEP